jgi:hypothetical protein
MDNTKSSAYIDNSNNRGNRWYYHWLESYPIFVLLISIRSIRIFTTPLLALGPLACHEDFNSYKAWAHAPKLLKRTIISICGYGEKSKKFVE